MIDVPVDFTRYPAGRYRTDGIFSGERFREDLLAPALRSHPKVHVKLDGTAGYGSSFLEEVFGGIARSGEFTVDQLLQALELESNDPSLIDEITEYITSIRH